jgi:hypothetical protein
MASTWTTLDHATRSQDLSHVIGLLYDAASNPALWSPFVEHVAKASQATSAGLIVHDFQQPLCTVSGSWELAPDLQGLYEAHYHSVDVWAERLTLPTSSVVVSQAICPLHELKKTEIYNELYIQTRQRRSPDATQQARTVESPWDSVRCGG